MNVGELDRAELGDAADVVAAEVHEHDVLGPLLGVGQQFLLEGLVLGLVVARGGGCRRGGGWSAHAVLDAAEDLRARRR